jgi:hypothetical protein
VGQARALLAAGEYTACVRLLPDTSSSSASPPLWAEWCVARAAYGQGDAERAQALLQVLIL